MDEQQRQHWVFRVHVLDRAGALTSIASAFSNRGINLQTVVGHGAGKQAGREGTVYMTFRASAEQKDMMARVIRRSTKVTGLEERPYDSHSLRKSTVIRTTRRLAPRDVAGEEAFLTCELMDQDPKGWTYFLAGAPSELDPVLTKLESEGIVMDIVYTVMGL